MTEPTLPPVGATVTDADGTEWTMTSPLDPMISLGAWRTEYGDSEWRAADPNTEAPLCLALWRMQQERDQLKARVAELKRSLVRSALPYEALLLDAPSRNWIAPEVWEHIEAAVLAARRTLAQEVAP